MANWANIMLRCRSREREVESLFPTRCHPATHQVNNTAWPLSRHLTDYGIRNGVCRLEAAGRHNFFWNMTETKRKFRFGLRGLAVVVTLLAVLLALIVGPEVRRRMYQAKWREMGWRIKHDATRHDEVTWLILQSTQVRALPPDIEQLPNLTELYLDDSQLQSVPSEIGNLKKLTYVSLGGNQFQSIPAEISELTNLTGLYLGQNQLKSVSPEISQLTNLTELDLGQNQLRVIPAELSQLAKLTRLALYSNKLQVLLPEIGQLTNLSWLDISDNQLTELPRDIEKLTKLTYLDISGNQISEEEIKRLKKTLPNCEIIWRPARKK